MLRTVSDNPAIAVAVTGFIASAIALLVAFGVHITPEQTQAILAFITALWGVLGIIGHFTTVPKTPSSVAAPLQVPPPGTVLVTTAAAEAPGPVPLSATVASPAP